MMELITFQQKIIIIQSNFVQFVNFHGYYDDFQSYLMFFLFQDINLLKNDIFDA